MNIDLSGFVSTENFSQKEQDELGRPDKLLGILLLVLCYH